MANRKISDLTALTTTATGDLLPIVDISEAAAADKNKKITVENLFKGIPGNVGIGTSSPTGLLTVATATAGTAADFVIGNPANLWSIKTGTTTNALTIVDTQFSVERLRIDSSGRLLVGTSSDSGGALLQVNGDRIRVGTAKTPASASATGTTGEICWDANYIYVCTATNTWKRTAIATW